MQRYLIDPFRNRILLTTPVCSYTPGFLTYPSLSCGKGGVKLVLENGDALVEFEDVFVRIYGLYCQFGSFVNLKIFLLFDSQISKIRLKDDQMILHWK